MIWDEIKQEKKTAHFECKNSIFFIEINQSYNRSTELTVLPPSLIETEIGSLLL
jgi:hypothetical protein